MDRLTFPVRIVFEASKFAAAPAFAA